MRTQLRTFFWGKSAKTPLHQAHQRALEHQLESEKKMNLTLGENHEDLHLKQGQRSAPQSAQKCVSWRKASLLNSVQKKYLEGKNNNNGKPWKLLKILRVKPKFLHFCFSTFFYIFRCFFHFFIFIFAFFIFLFFIFIFHFSFFHFFNFLHFLHFLKKSFSLCFFEFFIIFQHFL